MPNFLTEPIEIHCGNVNYAFTSKFYDDITDPVLSVLERGMRTGKEYLEARIAHFASIADCKKTVLFSNDELIMYAARLAVKRKLLATDKIVFVYHTGTDEYEVIRIQPDGCINEWPEGFFDISEQALIELF